MLWHCFLGVRKSTWPVKLRVMVICLMQIVCIWSSWCHCIPKPHHLLPRLNPDWFYLSGTGWPRSSWKRVVVVMNVDELAGCWVECRVVWRCASLTWSRLARWVQQLSHPVALISTSSSSALVHTCRLLALSVCLSVTSDLVFVSHGRLHTAWDFAIE